MNLLLSKDAEKRPSCEEILKLPFIQESIKYLILDFKTNINLMHHFYLLSKEFPDIYNLKSFLSSEELVHIESTLNGESNTLLNNV